MFNIVIYTTFLNTNSLIFYNLHYILLKIIFLLNNYKWINIINIDFD